MRRLLGALIGLALTLGSQASADSIKVVVPFAAGGPVDMLARLVSADMQTRLKSEMVVENRGGAGGVLATEAGCALCARRQDAAVRKLGLTRHQRRAARQRAELRRGEIFCADRFRRRRAHAGDRQRGLASQDAVRTDRQGQGRETFVWFGRAGLDDAHHRRGVQRRGRGQGRARAVSRRRARAERSDGRAHPVPERRPAGAGAAGQERQGARARAVCDRAIAAVAGPADQRRAWLSRHADEQLVRHAGARRHFCRRRKPRSRAPCWRR